MKISYAITVCNEVNEIKKLIPILLEGKRQEDEIVVLFDKQNGTAEVWSYLQEQDVKCKAKSFNHHFADWKNYLTTLCSGDYIFQIDADEYPHDSLISQLPVILEANPENEVYVVPRVNTVKGLTDDHIQQWRWNVNEKGWVNWPDYQWRVWKNLPHIKWKNKVHEKLDGYKTYAALPTMEGLALYHPKEIKRQEKQNKYYETL
ncbi:glycosyltransferase [bacterium]|jgi:glycosyltransferase involved in cell wall biosynthesis|nr:glycosyltransferase [bacterium]